ncbi:MAG TPA: glycosyltransferase [Terriglobales bacterium]|nr:glycosyltransferase [Terriglobales bacterium]
MKIVILGLSITSSWGNGHATTFRALARALHKRGHCIVFYEHDVEWYASNRDLPNPPFCEVRLFHDWRQIRNSVKQELSDSDVAMVGSYFPDGLQAIDDVFDSHVPVKTFYDIDTPITVSDLRAQGRTTYLRADQVPGFDVYFSFTGGPMLREIESRFGAKRAVPLYCSFDPEEYRNFGINKRFACDLSYMGTYAHDRQPKINELLCEPAQSLAEMKFLVAGPQYPKSIKWPENVRRIVHLNPRWHARFYSSSRFTLNVTRRDMVQAGYSPSVRLFEAAACAATIISDNWPGLDTFFSPGEEILLPVSSKDVVHLLRDVSPEEARGIGRRAQQRVLSEHTSGKRAEQFELAIGSKQRRNIDSQPAISDLVTTIHA